MCLISMNLCFSQAAHNSGVFLGSFEEPPGGEALYRQATQACNPFLGSLMKGLAVVIESSGDASHVGSILIFFGIWEDSERNEG